jgi:hypothetical protein
MNMLRQMVYFSVNKEECQKGVVAMSALRKPTGTAPAIRVPPATHHKLQELARKEDRSMGEIVTDLVTRYEDEQFWTSYQEGYRRLRADPDAWKDYVAELEAWDAMPNEVLDAEEPYFTPAEEEAFLARAAKAESR